VLTWMVCVNILIKYQFDMVYTKINKLGIRKIMLPTYDIRRNSFYSFSFYINTRPEWHYTKPLRNFYLHL